MPVEDLWRGLARGLVLLMLVVAPWPFACVPLEWQPAVFAFVPLAILAELAAQIAARCSRTSRPPVVTLPAMLLPAAGFVVLTALQVAPGLGSFGNQPYAHAVFAELLPQGFKHLDTVSIAPSLTRLQLARYLAALGLVVLSCQLFRTVGARRWLFGLVAANGSALAFFGIVQRLSWNEKLFWVVPLPFGGQPFASFINRNNGAGYLNLAFSSACGLAIAAIGLWYRPGRSISGRLGVHRDARDTFSLMVISGLIFTAAGTICSSSRGGMLALLLGGLGFVGLCISRHGWRFMIPISWIVGAAVGGLVLFSGLSEQVRARVGALADMRKLADEARALHWQSTWKATTDFPWVGSGLGTYLYVNLPYQREDMGAWFHNADNQYFEVLIEMGAVGLALVVAGGLAFGVNVVSLLRKRWGPGADEAAAVGLVLLVTQGAQAFVDFGPSVTANLLTIASLVGAVCAALTPDIDSWTNGFEPDYAASEDLETLSDAMPTASGWLQSAVEGWPAVSIVSLLLGATAWGWWEIERAAQCERARIELPVIDRHDAAPDALVRRRLINAETALRARPDDLPLHLAMARTWIGRYREQMYEMVRDTYDPGTPAATIWGVSSLDALQSVAANCPQRDRQNCLQLLRTSRPVQNNLRPAFAHLELSLRDGAMTPSAALDRACLAVLTDDSGEQWIRNAAMFAVGQTEQLIRAGDLARQVDAADVTRACWRRVVKLRPEFYMRLAPHHAPWSLEEFVTLVPPPQIEMLLQMAETSRDPALRTEWLKTAATLLATRREASSLPEGVVREDWLSVECRLEYDQQHWDASIRAGLEALRRHPENSEVRILLARGYEQQKNLDGVIEQLKLYLRTHPDRDDVKRWLKQARDKKQHAPE